MRPLANWCLAIIGLALFGCNKDASPTATSSTPTTNSSTSVQGQALDKLETKDLKVGTGKTAKSGDTLVVTYTGSLKDGSVFDSNDKPGGKPFRFMLGAGSVIKGWDQGMVGMKVGGERKLSIPSSLGYGNTAQGDKIPAGSDLFFDVKLESDTDPADLNTVLSEDKKKGTGTVLKAGDTAVINYSITGEDGAIIDDKYEKTPYTFKVGGNETLAAVDVGIRGMKLGGERVLTVPSMYAPHGPDFPAGSSFKFDIKLRSIKPGK